MIWDTAEGGGGWERGGWRVTTPVSVEGSDGHIRIMICLVQGSLDILIIFFHYSDIEYTMHVNRFTFYYFVEHFDTLYYNYTCRKNAFEIKGVCFFLWPMT